MNDDWKGTDLIPMKRKDPATPPHSNNSARVADRKQLVRQFTAEGLSPKQIAARLDISASVVRANLRN